VAIASFQQLIVEWPGGRSGFAADMGLTYEGARAMSTRNNINAKHWSTVLKAAKRHHVRLSIEDLLRMSRARRRNRRGSNRVAA